MDSILAHLFWAEAAFSRGFLGKYYKHLVTKQAMEWKESFENNVNLSRRHTQENIQ
jgi:hypothetical protein